MLIVADVENIKSQTRYVKKTLSIPHWLNVAAEKEHINFHYSHEGFSFASMSDFLIEGFDYPDDIPPSTADYGEVPVTFRVAKRG